MEVYILIYFYCLLSRLDFFIPFCIFKFLIRVATECTVDTFYLSEQGGTKQIETR